jgi:hypothetical protein
MSTHTTTTCAPAGATHLYGLMAEFDDVDSLLTAAEKVRDAGYTRWESFTPFPVHGLDRAMGAKPTVLPWVVLCCGLFGMLNGLFLVWWTNATSMDGVPFALRGYQFVISGKPIFSLPANIPPIFELTILFSAFGAFFGMLAMNKLPQFHHPVFNCKRFGRVTTDKFFIGIEALDERFDRSKTEQLLRDGGARVVEEVLED